MKSLMKTSVKLEKGDCIKLLPTMGLGFMSNENVTCLNIKLGNVEVSVHFESAEDMAEFCNKHRIHFNDRRGVTPEKTVNYQPNQDPYDWYKPELAPKNGDLFIGQFKNVPQPVVCCWHKIEEQFVGAVKQTELLDGDYSDHYFESEHFAGEDLIGWQPSPRLMAAIAKVDEGLKLWNL